MRRREFLATAPAALAAAQRTPGRPRLRRRDAFFGLHFDLHPNNTDTALGRDVSDEMVGQLLDRVRPDFVQYDCKGHVGWLGYPDSKVSPSAPGIVRDSLAIWRRQTAARGVALFIHFSGVWDSLAVEQHPEWARVGPDGKPDKNQTSLFGPYVDQRMIPQLREAGQRYDLDGAWVDGECWATKPDYCEAAAKAWGKPLPEGPKDPGWIEFLEFHRETFRRYVEHYVNAIHGWNPQFQVASNWLYTTYVPERPTLPVDFLSGDYLGNAAISAARLDARYLAATGKPWDLMAWGFQWGRNNAVGSVYKPAAQLQQEAAVVLAQGGGFQVYYQPTRAGYFDGRLVGTMELVAKFCRDRQQVCHKSQAAPQVGLLFSKHTLYRKADRLFGGWGEAVDPARGLLDALVESHYSVDVIPDWNLPAVASEYPMIAVPDWADIGEEAHGALLRYVEAGGRLLLAGAENARLFAADAGAEVSGEAGDKPAFVAGAAVLGNMTGRWQALAPGRAEVIEHRYANADTTRDSEPAAFRARIGKGQAVILCGPAGRVFAATHDPAVREFVARVIGRIWKPDLEVQAPPTVEVALRRKGTRIIVHLSNATAMQTASDYSAIDFVPAVRNIGVSLRMAKPPRRVQAMPGAFPIEGKWAGGVWRGRVSQLDVHSAVVFES